MCQREICLAENGSSIYITSKENYAKLEMSILTQSRKTLDVSITFQRFITVSFSKAAKIMALKYFKMLYITKVMMEND